MPHVVTERCVDCRYTDCCAVCPVECFWEVENPAMLVIDPQTCIDCGLCIPECPIYAIYPLDEVPEPYREWVKKNEELFPKGKQITVKKESLASAIPLDKIHEKEKAKGLKVADPSAVGGSAPAAGAAKKKETAKPEAAAAKPAEGAAAASTLSPAEAAKAAASSILAKKLGTDAERPLTGPAGYRPIASKLPRPPVRPDLELHSGDRVKLGYRTGTIQVVRRGPKGLVIDVRILFHGEEKPIWFLYSSLQTSKEKGDLQLLESGPRPGLLRRMFG
jgi:ferredoxin